MTRNPNTPILKRLERRHFDIRIVLLYPHLFTTEAIQNIVGTRYYAEHIAERMNEQRLTRMLNPNHPRRHAV